MKRFQAIILGAFAVAAASCGGSDSPSGTNNGGTNTINASNSLVFAPNTLNVAVGTTVTFTFGSVDHNVIFGGTAGAPASIETSHSTSVTRTFNTAGTFAFVCSLHNGMGGAVVVGGATTNTYTGY